MSTYNEQTLEMAGLGRPFQLGMLYDCRSETLIPGVTLWSKEALKNNSDPLKKFENSHFEVISEDNLDRKAHCFDVDGNLKLSILSGLISVEGAGKYLENNKTSHQQARVTLRYHCNTFFEQLTMDQLAVENIQYKDVFEKGTATHVVTGIQYGVNAVFVFDRELSSNEDCSKVEGMLKAVIDKIPGVPMSGQGATKIKGEEEKEVDKFHCTFHGDLMLKKHPRTFSDAVSIYETLPDVIMENLEVNDGVYGVPKKIFLYPLSKLDSQAAKLVRIVSADLVEETQHLLEKLSVLQVTAADLINGAVSRRFPGIQEQVSKFKSLISRFVTQVQQKLVDILPKIRGGDEAEVVLADKIKQLKKSPFEISKLETWIEAKKQESRVIQQYLSSLQDFAFASLPGEVEQHVQDNSVKYVLALSFGTIASKSHSFIDDMNDYLDHPEDVTESCDSFDEHWFDNDNIMSALRRQVGLFIQFAAVNKTNPMLKCIVMASADRKTTHHSPGDTFLYVDGSKKQFQPPSCPGAAEMVANAEYEMEIKWACPESGLRYVERYVVTYRLASDTEEKSLCRAGSMSSEPWCRITYLEPNTSYVFKVAAVCEAGVSEYSLPSQPLTTKALPSLAEIILPECKLISAAHGLYPAWYMLPLRETYHDNQLKLRKVEVGTASPLAHGTKVILVVGATGSGKTTLINGMVNYLFGIRLEDKFRFKLIAEDLQKGQANSLTQYITAYTIHWRPESSVIKYTLVIIDTPGYGDTRGIEQDDKLTHQIRGFFEMHSSEAIDQIDGVGFVTQASAARLSPTQKYVFDSILAIFGRDITDNIFLMFTFADDKPPPALDGIEEHKLPYKHYFKFNNSVFTQVPTNTKPNNAVLTENPVGTTRSATQNFDALFWTLAENSFADFFKLFHNVEPRSLTLTREVLSERQHLEVYIEFIQQRITSGVNHLSQMRQELLIIEQYEVQKTANKQFTRKVQVPKTRRHFFKEPGRYVTNCLICSITCHQECKIANDNDKYLCAAMQDRGNPNTTCAVCNGHCDWRQHVHRDHYFEEYMEEEVVTIDDLKKKYDLADKNLSEKSNILLGIAEEYNNQQIAILQYIEMVRKCLVRLDEIAMKRNPLTTVEYIDILIRSTKSEKKFGWEHRLEQLENARKRADMIQQMIKEGKQYDPFKDLRDDIHKEAAKSKSIEAWLKEKVKGFFGGQWEVCRKKR